MAGGCRCRTSGCSCLVTAGAGLAVTGSGTSASPYVVASAVPHSVVRKTATESVTSSTTFQDDNHLLLPISANSVYVFTLNIVLTSGAGAGGIKVEFAIPSGASITWTTLGFGSTAAAGGVSLTTQSGADFHGTVTTAATAGNLQVRWAQSSSSGTATTLAIGSFLLAHKIV